MPSKLKYIKLDVWLTGNVKFILMEYYIIILECRFFFLQRSFWGGVKDEVSFIYLKVCFETEPGHESIFAKDNLK